MKLKLAVIFLILILSTIMVYAENKDEQEDVELLFVQDATR